jgi:multidrug efflux pump
MAEPGVNTVSTWVGSGVPRFYLPLDQVFPQSNVSQMIVRGGKDLKLRESLRVKLPALLAPEFPKVRGRVKLLPNGPPVPYPVQFRVLSATTRWCCASAPTRSRPSCARARTREA